jgi:hypothetical protein
MQIAAMMRFSRLDLVKCMCMKQWIEDSGRMIVRCELRVNVRADGAKILSPDGSGVVIPFYFALRSEIMTESDRANSGRPRFPCVCWLPDFTTFGSVRELKCHSEMLSIVSVIRKLMGSSQNQP